MVDLPREARTLRGLAALLGSAVVHGVLLGGLALHTSLLPKHAILSPLRFSGQTFEVDALGAPSEEDAAPSAKQDRPPAAAVEQAAQAAHVPAPDEALPPPEKKPPPAETSPPEAEGSRLPERTTPDAPSSLAPAQPSRNAPAASSPDPFDLGLPGEPTTATNSPPRPPTGAYGQNTDAPATVDVFAAFLKTLPLAAKTDPEWSRLPLGNVGEIEFVVTVNESGALLPIRVIKTPTSAPPPVLERAVLRNRNFLLHGRFALSPDQASGSQHLRLTARVETRPPDANHPDADGVRGFGLHGGWPPTGTYFTYFSGKHVEIRMTRVP